MGGLRLLAHAPQIAAGALIDLDGASKSTVPRRGPVTPSTYLFGLRAANLRPRPHSEGALTAR